MGKFTKVACTATALGALTASGYAVESGVSASATPAHHSKSLYSDRDVTQLLLAGQGPIAQKFPATAKTLRADGARARLNSDQLDLVLKALNSVDTNYHQHVTAAVQKNDPYAAKQAFNYLGQDLRKIANRHPSEKSSTGEASADGIVYHDANIVSEVNVAGVVNAIGYANVAGATEAVVALVVVPDFVSYGFDLNAKGSLDNDAAVSSLTAI